MRTALSSRPEVTKGPPAIRAMRLIAAAPLLVLARLRLDLNRTLVKVALKLAHARPI